MDRDQPYHAIYLKEATLKELLSNITNLMAIPLDRVQDCCTLGPNGVQVLLNDDVSIYIYTMYSKSILASHDLTLD